MVLPKLLCMAVPIVKSCLLKVSMVLWFLLLFILCVLLNLFDVFDGCSRQEEWEHILIVSVVCRAYSTGLHKKEARGFKSYGDEF